MIQIQMININSSKGKKECERESANSPKYNSKLASLVCAIAHLGRSEEIDYKSKELTKASRSEQRRQIQRQEHTIKRIIRLN